MSKAQPAATVADPKAHAFQEALRRVLRVSKDDLKRLIEEDKQAKAGKPKRGPKPRSYKSLL
jgi:hypothetical protein